MAVDLSANFEQFLQNISLGDPQVPRMNSAARTVSDFLLASYDIAQGNVFLQGSYANGTAIEPVRGGEYDVDLVAVCVGGNTTADDALSELEKRFRSDGRFRARVRRKQPCVRLEYAEDNVGGFHVDVVPVRYANHDAPLEAPRRGEGWHETAPAEYTRWCTSQGAYFLRTVKMLKRWRAEQQSVRTAVKSIVLQVLVAQCMPSVADDADRITQTFRNLHAHLAGMTRPPVVLNPVLPTENLAGRWTQESFASFVRELDEAVQWADQAMAATDVIEATDIWRELLGDDFPARTPTSLGFHVGDYSHAQTPSDRGWAERSDARYAVEITASTQRGKRGQTRRPYSSGGPVVFAGHKLRFKAEISAPNHVDVWWQVANTGAHARNASGLRGEIFRARDSRRGTNSDQTENWENTAYTGSHLVRALLVRNNEVVATSAWFVVNIYARGRPFRP
ncbi:nucleotidyltransferase [Conexibacter woesei]|uniref:Adenylyl/Guanylyl and SMODS C-terminal sensor domain-containing protein n=1 Tax=Conexibacter woesei (strain DSM 14684 / CCUG 47730 / CIP 108061 / JCM 11494 / NBRC 100937 / ID131577) TaxID=469383 RepID=D3FAS8_CONWI|nr:nucleotidyltransferase [Conexibacter woesei]ADB51241.1 hypothetical protein Cwoe_2822 [Conexibacter woesei DSM 14684]